MKEVSCRVFGLCQIGHAQLGISKETLLQGTTRSWDYMSNPRNRVDWDEWIRITENAYAAIGSDEGVNKIVENWAYLDGQKPFRRMAGFFISLDAVFRLFVLMARSTYGILKVDVRRQPDKTYEVILEIPKPYTTSRAFLVGGKGGLSTIPCLIGLPPARVEQDITERRGVYRIYPPPEKTLWRRLHVLPGSIAASFSFFRIIRDQNTELAASYNQLEQQTINFRNVLAASSDGIAVVRDGQIIHANPALAHLLHFPSIQELLGQRTDHWLTPAKLAELRAWAGTQPAENERREVTLQPAIGEAIIVEFSAPRAITWENLPATLWLLRDITERRALQIALATARQREQASLARDLHDGLGQLLTGLAFKLKALETRLAQTGSPEAAATTEMLSLANQATAQARDLAHGLAPVDIDPQGLAPALRHLAMSVSQLFQLCCTFSTEGPPAILPREVANQLYRATQEAITNAHRHGRARTVSILLRQTVGELTLLIDDDGTGLPADFVAARSPGMGLKIMRHRLTSVEGSFNIERSPTLGGARVSLTAPVKNQAEINTPGGRSVSGSPATISRPTGSRWRVLLVDDHVVVRAGLGQLLEQTPDFAVCGEASSPTEAEAACRDLAPDLLVTDLRLGEENALDYVRRLRVSHPALRIVMLTMYGKDNYEKEARSAGAEAYVMKQAAPDELISTLRKVTAEGAR